MSDRGIYEDLTPLQRRAGGVRIAIDILFILLAAFYWKIQVLDHAVYWARAEANRTRESYQPAPRGPLYDRTGRILLADNTASFKVSLVREDIPKGAESYEDVGRLLDLDPKAVAARIEEFRALPAFKPIIIKDNLSLEDVARIEARRNERPELRIEIDPKRSYPYGDFAAHLIGYMQELTPEELKTIHKGRRAGDMAGKTGVEEAHEKQLAGREGQVVEIVDSLGRVREEIVSVEPVPAAALNLTIDFDMQKKAQELLLGREGAVVVLSPKTGDILALASSPTYDPNLFIKRFTRAEWQALSNDPAKPLLNRAIREVYSPGSTFKPVMAVAGLRAGAIGPGTVFFCGGKAEFYGREFTCMFAHGELALPDAIRHSCNIYFYNVGRRLGVDAIADTCRRLGLGRKTGVDLPGELDGLVPSTEWKKRTRNEEWFPGETISVAIGQGPLNMTPLQMAALTATIANRGRIVRPRVVLDGSAPRLAETGIPAEIFEPVIEGMWRGVNAEGTGRGAFIEGLDICGKTGSTQTISTEKIEQYGLRGKRIKTHSWFIGFSSRRDPQIAVAVIVEFGGHGGETAAPIAREIFAIHKAKHAGPNPPAGN